MVRYVDLDKIVAEIERRLEELYKLLPDASKVENGMITISEACNTGKYTELESFRKFIDTLKVKEADLEKVIVKYNGQLSEDELFRIAEQIYNC